MTDETLLALDCGTQSARALIFDLRGNLIARSQVKFPPYLTPMPGAVEQQPEVFWQAICDACQNLWQMPGVVKESLQAVALTTQRATVINLDKDLKPLRPAMSWMDNRRTEGLKPVGGLWGLAFHLTGMTDTVAHLQAEAEANWLRTHQPGIWERTHKYLLLSGYLTLRLVGEVVDSIGCTVGYLPFDYQKQTWASRFDWKWQAVPMDKSMLPALRRPTEKLGAITRAAAQATGIPEGLPLIAAAADKACEVIGSGALEPHIACLSFGTAATINTTHQKYVEVIPLIPPYPSAVPGAYSLEIQIFRGFWMVSWFRREFGLNEERLAADRGVEPEFLFDDLVNSVPPGAEGLLLQPFWSPGLKVPGPEARGAIIGFSDVHTRAHLYRAIIEGLAYALREGAERTTRRSGIPVTEVRIAGGGSQSEAAMQITADVFGLPTAKPHIYEASGLGAAIDVAVGMKLHPDFTTAVREMTRLGKTYEPNPHHHAIYEDLYHRVYCQMYRRLKPLYHELKSLSQR